MFKITNGALSIGAKSILEEINLFIKDNSKIAIVGRNGAGKSSLLKAILDPSLLDAGISDKPFMVYKKPNLQIGYLSQDTSLDKKHTLKEELLSVYKLIIELEARIKKLEIKLEEGASTDQITLYLELKDQFKIMGGYEYQKEYQTAIKKLGFTGLEEQLIENFSGGERTKIAFLKLLLSKPELLILDEPTNHLDIDAILWLESYLKNYPYAYLIVSHDRYFINQVCNEIILIEYGKTETYHGNYEYYEKERKERYNRLLKDYEYQQKEIKRLEDIANRFRYKPSKASMAMSKLKQIERMTKIDNPKKANTNTFHLKNIDLKESGKIVLTTKNLRIGYQTPISIPDITIERKDRIGVIGPNGCGKSTLLKTIMNYIPKLNGDIEMGIHVSIGYFDQQLNTLNQDFTVYQEIEDSYPKWNDYEIRSALAVFQFFNDDIDKKINCLSGGEKVRLELCKIIYKFPNFLILDEPTNHLDILAKESLEELLENYTGTILVVSHDRFFLKKIAKSLLVFDDSVTYYNCTYQEYLGQKQEEKEIPKVIEKKKKKEIKTNLYETHKIEKEIGKIENKIKELEEEIYKPEVYNNYKKLQEISDTKASLESELDRLLEKL